MSVHIVYKSNYIGFCVSICPVMHVVVLASGNTLPGSRSLSSVGVQIGDWLHAYIHHYNNQHCMSSPKQKHSIEMTSWKYVYSTHEQTYWIDTTN